VPASTTENAGPGEPRGIDPEEWVANHGDYLFRHALARTSRRPVAEDLVQETFLAAWKSAHRYAGRASERTWLLGILRNKIADHYRRQQTDFTPQDLDALAQLEEQTFSRSWFGGRSWNPAAAPSAWVDARRDAEKSEFWQTIHECTHKLPEKTAQVFLLRELDGMDSETICHELNIKPSNLFVLLHRARLALRRCLELNWFRDRTGHN
jgi:RNA polymerase sigma-70 factor (ECF subfamily)